jgi:hypothetical protein
VAGVVPGAGATPGAGVAAAVTGLPADRETLAVFTAIACKSSA